MLYDLEKKVVCTGHGLRSPFPSTRQPPSSPVAVIGHSVCTGPPPPQNAFLDFFLTPFSFFPLSILQRRSGFTVLVGVGEDTVQCYIREHFSTLLACIAILSLLNHRFFFHNRRHYVLLRLFSLLSFLLPPTPAIP
jgi:hypothetical protein